MGGEMRGAEKRNGFLSMGQLRTSGTTGHLPGQNGSKGSASA